MQKSHQLKYRREEEKKNIQSNFLLDLTVVASLFLSSCNTPSECFHLIMLLAFVFTQRIPLEIISVDDEDDFDSIRPVRPHHTSTPMHQLQYQSSPRAFRPSSRTSGRTFHSTSYQVYPSHELPSPSAASGHTDPYGTIV